MDKCETCKWWEHDPSYDTSPDWGDCKHTETADNLLRIEYCAVLDFHKNFGCIHHQPKSEGE